VSSFLTAHQHKIGHSVHQTRISIRQYKTKDFLSTVFAKYRIKQLNICIYTDINEVGIDVVGTIDSTDWLQADTR